MPTCYELSLDSLQYLILCKFYVSSCYIVNFVSLWQSTCIWDKQLKRKKSFFLLKILENSFHVQLTLAPSLPDPCPGRISWQKTWGNKAAHPTQGRRREKGSGWGPSTPFKPRFQWCHFLILGHILKVPANSQEHHQLRTKASIYRF